LHRHHRRWQTPISLRENRSRLDVTTSICDDDASLSRRCECVHTHFVLRVFVQGDVTKAHVVAVTPGRLYVVAMDIKQCRQLAAMAIVGALGLGACATEDGMGEVTVRADALTRIEDITRVTLTAQPGGIATDLALNAQGYVGSLLVEAGPHTFEVRAFAGDRVVASGSASANVAADTVTAVQITVLDTTGPAPAPGHSPFLLSLTVGNAQPGIGDAVELTANVVDPDGDAITYAWTSSCAAGTLTNADKAAATWTATAAGTCTLKLDVAAGGHTLSRAVNITTAPDTGSIDVTATFVPHPRIYQMKAWNLPLECSVQRDATDASCLDLPVAPGQQLTVSANVTSEFVGVLTFSDNCGGAFVGPSNFRRWTAPATPAVCLLTATFVDGRYHLADSMSIAVAVR
jgi:hypothetical protein